MRTVGVVGDGVDREGAAPLVDALDSIAGEGGELAVGVGGDVALVVGARVLETAEQVLALGHHEQRRGTRLDLVGLPELDQRLLVLARVEELEAHLVVRACVGDGVVSARGRGGPHEGAREYHRQRASRALHLSG